MFPILLGKIKELEDKIKNLEPEPYDPSTNVVLLKVTNGVLDKKWSEINTLYKAGTILYINPAEVFPALPQKVNGREIVTSVYQYATNSYVVCTRSSFFSASSPTGYPEVT